MARVSKGPWYVRVSDLVNDVDRFVAKFDVEAEARELARSLNRAIVRRWGPRGPLCYAENERGDSFGTVSIPG